MAENFRVAGFVIGLAIKAPVHTVSQLNIAVLTGVGQNINGWIVGAGDRVLLTAQTNPIDNGIYSARTSAWIRDGDADGNRDFVGGTIVPVWVPGDVNVILYRLAGSPDAKTIGVDALTFTVYYDPSTTGLGEAPIDGTSYVREDAGWVSLPPTALPAAAPHSVLVGNPAGTLWIEAADITFPFGNSIILDQTASGSVTWRDGAVDVTLRNTAGVFTLQASVALDNVLIVPDTHFFAGFYLQERALSEADKIGLGQFWVQSEGDNVPMFTSDDGTEQLLDPSRSDIISVVASRVGVLADKGKTVGFSGSTAAQTMTIPAEGSVPYKIGTFLAWDNNGSVPFDIAITTDTLIFADNGATGTRTLLPDGMAVAHKIAAATWKIAGKQLT
jgi:hypothetical protein